MKHEKVRILIVDDSPSFRRSMQSLIEIQPDMQVIGVAANGIKAVESSGELQPDLVLLDGHIPGLTSLDVIKKIKECWPLVKIIMLTMYPGYRSLAIEAGADAFLTKGIPPEQFLAVIRGIRNTEKE